MLILASKSPARAALLENAGLSFQTAAADLDERLVEQPLLEAGAPPADIAEMLAVAKATAVSEAKPGALVLGGDQVLSLDSQLIHKSKNMDEARRKLLKLRGKTHQLSSALALVRDGEIVWSHVSVAHMSMRHLGPDFIGRYLAACGEPILGSVGCYQIEGRGIQLFDAIDGDHYTIIGMPMLPLLAKLRELGEIE